MHYIIDCYVAKAFTNEVLSHSTQAIHALHEAKTTLLSMKVLNSLEKLSWLLFMGYYHTTEAFVLLARSYAGCCSYTLRQNTVWHAQSFKT